MSHQETYHNLASHKESPVNAEGHSAANAPSPRLLLYEVLLEEYESLEQPSLDPQAVEKIREKVEGIREKGRRYKNRVACDRLDEGERERLETRFNGKLVARIYRLMREAQAGQTEAKRRKFETRCANIEDAHERQQIIDRAMILEVYGDLQTKREKLHVEHKSITEQEQRNDVVEQSIIEEIRKELQGSPTNAGHNTGAGGNGAAGNGDGLRKDTSHAGAEAEKADAQTYRSALCLSGGGIRSATFNLGILQGLARHGLLARFDYLSTVSGGGFVGGWLTAWMHRRGIEKVMKELGKSPRSPLVPDPKPIEHLRIFSNFLSPQPGLLSADTWTLAASIIRNLLLTWLVFIPLFIAALMVPRMWAASVLQPSVLPEEYAMPLSLGLGFVATIWVFIYIALRLPSSTGRTAAASLKAEQVRAGQSRFIWRCLLPMMIAVIAFATYLQRLKEKDAVPEWHWVGGFLVATIIIPLITFLYRRRQNARLQAVKTFWRLSAAALLILFAQFTSGFFWHAAITSLPKPSLQPLLYATFSVPSLLLMFGVTGTLTAGFTSRLVDDDDQEWWARAGAWLMITIIVWITFHLLVLCGPLLVVLPWNDLAWGRPGKVFGALIGVLSGVITLFGGFSSKTPANEKEAREAGLSGKALQLLTSLMAPVFLACVIILIAHGTNWLLSKTVVEASPYTVAGVATLLRETPLWYLLLTGALITLISLIMGKLINTNAFSLHYMWRNRIIRAYLGASRDKRQPNPFTGFDTYDNIHMYELRPQPTGSPGPKAGRAESDQSYQPPPRKLLHILNIALNLAGGEKLAWQDRKSESFTVSPLHAGSYWLGYRRAREYGGREGISLGTAVAISGAFVSPNMGYMMTSPVVRFLMTLFNLRFGWWLGNPGRAGDKINFWERLLTTPERLSGRPINRPWQRNSPRSSVISICDEALGRTSHKYPYVYLSDGGHFENLGLYEMVLRRCRFIVISDASTDPDYSFQSLAMSIRQVRVDLGVPIDLQELSITKPAQDMKGKYCAIGTIRYSCVDRKPHDEGVRDEDFDGVLIVIKPSLIGDEPRDVINYGQGSIKFPQEVIVDQWFSEAQFESYRALGSHIIDVICGGDRNPVNFAAFARKVREHNQLNFRAFQEKINYTAFEQQFKDSMQHVPTPLFQQRVREYLQKLLR